MDWLYRFAVISGPADECHDPVAHLSLRPERRISLSYTPPSTATNGSPEWKPVNSSVRTSRPHAVARLNGRALAGVR
jgi:hypothetical protein